MTSRLLWLAVGCALTCALTCAVDAATGPQVATQSGDLSGMVLKSLSGRNFYSFKGIPYAEPPLGNLRFRPPQPHAGWSGVRPATEFGSQCMQFKILTHPREMGGAEDCLFLNVHSPQLPTEDENPDMPVMVWIHGGGFTSGSGDSDIYGPDYLMDEDVVLVTFNYRLGPLGFFTTEDAAAPGNYGMRDQVLALEWVQANIAAFGGDPDQVTIFGESAGGAAVGLQVLSPRARGLFAKAISQSGASFCMFGASGEPQLEDAKKHAERLGCSTDSNKDLVGCMRQKPAEEIYQRLQDIVEEDPLTMGDLMYKPRVDVESRTPFLPLDPYKALKSGTFNMVPWLTGLTQDEGSLFVNLQELKPAARAACRARDWNQWVTLLSIRKAASDPAALAETLHRHYFGEGDCGDDTLQEYSDVLSDRWFTNCVVTEANLAAPHTPMYMYLLDHTGPGRQSFTEWVDKLLGQPDAYKDLGVGHSDDLLYLFRPEFVPAPTADSDEHKMIRFMVSLWTSFARRGYPSTDVLKMPQWPVYSSGKQEYMRLNQAPSVGRAPFSERREFWAGLDIQEDWHGPISATQHDEM